MTLFNHLISLELQGYKTFASKTDFKFPAQLTAIVGPNGSGKSNIADAVRWVLGEQAYSLLRGKKTIDMIFSGSEQRPRASMASVSITFDNQTGWLPIDYSEVNITRRAYRNGENEYLINNQRVRLKEINEMLANSGLAERNYTIIGQGLVDSALSLKPEDRRRFFEEAAGIGLYRSRRSNANQKLDKTLRNVERINDILTELKPRIRSLEKQQEKAKTYMQIDSDLKLLLKDWYGFHWRNTHKTLEESVAFNARQQLKLDERREVRQKLEEELNKSQNSLQTKREKLSTLHIQLSRLHVEKEEITRQFAVLEERQKSQKMRVIELESAWNEAKDRKIALEQEIAEFQKHNESDRSEFVNIKEALEEANTSLNERLDQRSDINTAIYKIEAQLNSNRQEVLRLSAITEGLKHQTNIQISDSEKIKLTNSQDQETFNVVAKEISKIYEEIEQFRAQKVSLEEKRISLESNLKVINNEIDTQVELNQKTEHLLRKLQAEFDLLDEAERAMAGFSTGAKNIIEALHQGKIKGNFALLMDLIIVPEEFEVAIVSALGNVAEGVIVNSMSETEAALQFIANSKTPRTILVLNQDKTDKGLSVEIPGNYRLALELVSCDDEVVPIIKNLLSTTLVVDDITDARKLVTKIPAGYHVVTMNGELFSANQTIAAGRESRVRSFTRKREKRTIKLEVEKTQKTFNEIKLILEQKSDEKQVLQKQLSESNEEFKQVDTKINNLTLDIHKLEIEQEQRKKQIESEQNRLKNLLNEIEKGKSDILELNAKKQEIEEQNESSNKEIEHQYHDLKELPVEELRASVTALTSKHAVAEKMVENNRNRIGEKENLLITFSQAIQHSSEQFNELKQQLEDIATNIQDVKASDAQVSSQIKKLSTEIQPLEKIVEDEITNQSDFLEKVDESRRKFAIAERHKLQSQMKVEKLRDKLETYQKKIGEDFGILMEDDEGSIFGPKPLPIDGIVASLPKLNELPEGLADQISQKKSLLRRVGPINPNASQEFEEVNNRYQFLTEQLQDLEKAEKDLRRIVEELDQLMAKEFIKTFKKVEVEFEKIFTQLFNGGKARLVIEDENNILDSGIEIEATLPGRRKQELALLSGGERSLTAVALIFSLLKISPTPFCILDEVDAMLDESNVVRFGELLTELSGSTQFIIITHNRNTVQLADIIYGVTMGKDSVSQVISLKLDELTDEMVH